VKQAMYVNVNHILVLLDAVGKVSMEGVQVWYWESLLS